MCLIRDLTCILITIIVIRLTRIRRILSLRVLIVIVVGEIRLAVASVVIIAIHFALYYRLQIYNIFDYKVDCGASIVNLKSVQ